MMATFPSRKVGGPDGAVQTFKANGTIPMVGLVKSNTTTFECVVAGTGTDQPFGVALYDERKAIVNDAEQYVDDDATRVEALAVGQVWNLKAEVAITKGDLCCAAAAGTVKKCTGTGEYAQFRALAAIDAAARGQFQVISGRFTTTAAGE